MPTGDQQPLPLIHNQTLMNYQRDNFMWKSYWHREERYYIRSFVALQHLFINDTLHSSLHVYACMAVHFMQAYITIIHHYIYFSSFVYIQGSRTEYLVQWKGYLLETCSWECASNIGSKPKRYILYIGSNIMY